MWQPIKIKITNLLSHLDTEYEFMTDKCVMIYGENLTDEGLDSNGSGKSVILEAITLAITGEVSRDVDRSEFINEDSDYTNVSLYLKNPIGEVKDLVIERIIHRTKAAKVIIHENGKPNTEMTSVNECNARIFELIGLTKFDLINFFLIGQEKKFSFLTAGDIEKKDIISRFSNVDFITEKINELKSESKANLSELEKFDKDVSINEFKIELLEEQVTNSKVDLKQKILDETKHLFLANERLLSVKKECNNDNTLIKKEVLELEKNIKKEEGVEAKIEELEKSQSKSVDSIKKANKELREAEHLKDHLQSILDGKISCPKCEFEFSLGEDMELSEIPEMIESCEVDIMSMEDKIKTLRSKSKKLGIQAEKLEEEMDEIKQSKYDLKNINRKLADNYKQIEFSEEKILKNLKGIEEIKNLKSDNSELTKKKAKIKELKSGISAIEHLKIPIQKNYENSEFWIHHFGKKGFMTFLTNKSIKSIEGITNSYLKRMKTDLQVEIDGYTVLKGGGNSDKINVSIVRSGRRVAKFNRYSGGEKGRIIIANILGLQKLINMSCPNGGLNFLGLDEVFEGLDVSGQIEVTKILEEIEMTTLVVSHMSKPIGVKNELTIKKIDGVSIIEKNY